MTARLLFDQNLPVRLTIRLGDIFPGTNHVYLAGLSQASDLEIWRYAREHGYAIITKDSDFNDLSLLFGVPPKIIWLRIGNTSQGNRSITPQALSGDSGFSRCSQFTPDVYCPRMKFVE